MAINYEDERLQAVEEEKQEKLTQAEETYGGMIEKAEQVYQEQIDATKQWEEQQKKIQQEQTDFAIQQTEQQKEKAQKDYTKEQSAAWVDYQKEKNAYGANAEQMAAAGLAGSGYSESSQVSMYNTYQARVAAARESITQAIADYDSGIQAAILQNNAALAEIEYQALQQRLTLALEGFQYQNQLVLALEEQKAAIDDTYHSRYLEVLEQLNTEEALAIAQAQASGGGSDGYLLTGDGTGAGGQDEVALTDDGSGGSTGGSWRRKERSVTIPQGVGREYIQTAAPTMGNNLSKVNGNQNDLLNQMLTQTLNSLADGKFKIVASGALKNKSDNEIEQMIANGEVEWKREGTTITVWENPGSSGGR